MKQESCGKHTGLHDLWVIRRAFMAEMWIDRKSDFWHFGCYSLHCQLSAHTPCHIVKLTLALTVKLNLKEETGQPESAGHLLLPESAGHLLHLLGDALQLLLLGTDGRLKVSQLGRPCRHLAQQRLEGRLRPREYYVFFIASSKLK